MDKATAIAAAVQTLAIDRVTAEVVEALAEAGIPAILLKGPSISRWLYPSGGRVYGDSDLLVRPSDYQAAAGILRSLGSEGVVDGFDALEREPSGGTAFVRSGAPGNPMIGAVDLHHGLNDIPASDEDVWDVLAGDTDTMLVGGVEVAVLGRANLALHIVLHAVHHAFDFHTEEDLRRALEGFTFDEWAEAARRARRLGVADVLGFGLRRNPAGAAIADRLGLPLGGVRNPSLQRRLDGAPRGVPSLALAWSAPTPAEKARRVRLGLVPSPAKVRLLTGLPGASGPLLLVAYVRWWLGLIRDLPSAVGFVVRRRLVPARRPTRSEVRAALWAVRAIVQARRGVRRMPLAQVRLPAPPPVPDEAFAGVGGVLRRWPQKCLVRSLVLQRWHAAHGRPQELVIGVTAPSAGFQAHAWLADEDPCHHDQFTELLRNPPPAGR